MDNWNAELVRTGEENIKALKNSAIIALGATARCSHIWHDGGLCPGTFSFRYWKS